MAQTTPAKGRSRLATILGGATAIGLLATATIGNFEGLKLFAYRDVIGVWTACYGETKGIRPGMKFTRQQCDVMFIGRLAEFETGMRACLKAPDAVPAKVYVADLSLAYNVGVRAFCGSTLVRLQNAGQLRASCDEFYKWNRAGGKIVPGLARRREAERQLCLEGVK